MPEANPNRPWRSYLDDMIGFCAKVQALTHGLGKAQLASDTARLDATIRNIKAIGEAATHIPEHVRLSSRTIHWGMVVATRDQLAHDHAHLDHDMLWSVVETDIPALHISLQALRATLPT